MMESKIFLKSLRLRNFLSFSPSSEKVELLPLNVIIGPNSSGKSNFIEAVNILRTAGRDIQTSLLAAGGFNEILWKDKSSTKAFTIDYCVNLSKGIPPLHHSFSIFLTKSPYNIIYEEIIDPENPAYENDFFYKDSEGIKKIKTNKPKGIYDSDRKVEDFSISDFNPTQSVLSQLKDILSYPEITVLGNEIEKIRIFNNWYVGKGSFPRNPQKTDLPSDFLLENLSNFALILNDLKDRRETRDLLIEKLKLFYEEVESIKTELLAGTVQAFFYEKSLNEPIPATRLSDGTLRYLCLLMILCHPEPPPLICIEEPEIGLHPDIMPTLAELLIDASKRTQLIVTTHSNVLVSALSEIPESIIVCEHDENGTSMKRLEKDKLKTWLDKYTLGELWTMGEIGGTRW